ncbi:dUTPase [Allofustis seminis]|uniref:dUTPase n=1 Tax=Allofustis seminis TaxID=166939 RepID=UPI00037BFFCC|nr:dUTPase [Allofustis seminis]
MSKKLRGFERVSRYGQEVAIPKRATHASAGYDLAAAKTVTVPSIWHQVLQSGYLTEMSDSKAAGSDNSPAASTLVPTGVKAYMPEDEVLLLVNRSSNAMKNQLALPNGIGVIDADYYNNPKNEGEIFVQLINYGFSDYTIQKGDRIAQGIFVPYYTSEAEEAPLEKRTGGFGSSGI